MSDTHARDSLQELMQNSVKGMQKSSAAAACFSQYSHQSAALVPQRGYLEKYLLCPHVDTASKKDPGSQQVSEAECYSLPFFCFVFTIIFCCFGHDPILYVRTWQN